MIVYVLMLQQKDGLELGLIDTVHKSREEANYTIKVRDDPPDHLRYRIYSRYVVGTE